MSHSFFFFFFFKESIERDALGHVWKELAQKDAFIDLSTSSITDETSRGEEIVMHFIALCQL